MIMLDFRNSMKMIGSAEADGASIYAPEAKGLIKLCGIEPDMVMFGLEAIERMRNETYDI